MFQNICYIHNSLKQGDTLTPVLPNCALEYAIRMVQVDEKGLEFVETY
jgi:hypothetical protein